ncbi:tRNA (guanosine(37)-N1)-methyltransferase TrmD [bacterium]|nr:tRNA (guanosine(37)-N1)-methyltransferase TrmD [bacterium]
MLTLHALTLFPDELSQFLCKGIIKRSHEKELLKFCAHDLRNFGKGKHRKVDDYPFSDHKSMLLRADVIYDAITSINGYEKMTIMYVCPRGKQFNQAYSQKLFESNNDIILISGYYEGVDERLFDMLPIQRISIGDYIVNSGDCAVAVIAESIIRQVPGVLGNKDCIYEDSYCKGLLEGPKYTQPVTLTNDEVPSVLREGNHQAIARYTQKMALYTTLVNRPDLLGSYSCNKQQQDLITTLLNEMAET